jgi:hypothetical protein
VAARPGVFVQTPKSDIYVTLLAVALGAMIIGCILLVLILNQYGFQTKVSALTAPSPGSGSTATRTAPALLAANTSIAPNQIFC